jgi:hypothetical protein
MRVEGKFRDSDGNIPEGQLVSCTASQLERGSGTDGSFRTSQVLLYLLRRCYGLCYRLMASSEPVSEELMPIANVSRVVARFLRRHAHVLTRFVAVAETHNGQAMSECVS